jgi:hypothetical protein
MEIAKLKSSSPIAKAEMDLKMNQLKTQMVPELRKFEDGLIVQRLSNQNSPEALAALDRKMSDLAISNPESFKQYSERYIPGVGMSSKSSVPQSARDGIEAAVEFNHVMKQYEDFAKKHGGTVMDRGVVNEGKALAAKAQELYRRASEGGVFKAGEQDFIEGIIPSDPTQFFPNWRTLSKSRPIMDANQHALETKLKANGFKLPQGSPMASQSNQSIQEGTIGLNKATGQRIIFRNNKWIPYNG